MVLSCEYCGRKFYLQLGEQEWLEKHCMKGTFPKRCVNCEANRLTYPVERPLSALAGTIRLHSKEKQFDYHIPPPANKLRKPRATLGSSHASIQWQHYKLGKTSVARLPEEIKKGQTEIELDRAEDLPHGEQKGVTITIGYVHRQVLSWDAETFTATIDEPFSQKISSATEYEIFQSAKGTGDIPFPLCSDRHSVVRKFQREAKIDAQKREFAKIHPQLTRQVQATYILDKWGPPCRLDSELKMAEYRDETRPRMKRNCQNFVDAIVRFAHRRPGVLEGQLTRQRMTLAIVLGMHERIGEQSLFRYFKDEIWILQLIVHYAFTTKHHDMEMPEWQLLDRAAWSMSEMVKHPCAVTVANVDKDTLDHSHKLRAQEAEAEIKRLKAIAASAQAVEQVSLHKRIWGKSAKNLSFIRAQSSGDDSRGSLGGSGGLFPSDSHAEKVPMDHHLERMASGNMLQSKVADSTTPLRQRLSGSGRDVTADPTRDSSELNLSTAMSETELSKNATEIKQNAQGPSRPVQYSTSRKGSMVSMAHSTEHSRKGSQVSMEDFSDPAGPALGTKQMQQTPSWSLLHRSSRKDSMVSASLSAAASRRGSQLSLEVEELIAPQQSVATQESAESSNLPVAPFRKSGSGNVSGSLERRPSRLERRLSTVVGENARKNNVLSNEEKPAEKVTQETSSPTKRGKKKKEYISLKHRVQNLITGQAMHHREAADKPERIFVCDDEAHCVFIFLSSGKLERTIGKGVMHLPGGVALDQNSRLLVTDRWLHCIHVYDCLGNCLDKFGSYGSGIGQLNSPSGIAVDKAGLIYVCDTNNHRVQVFSAEGKPIEAIGSLGWKEKYFSFPRAVSVDLNDGRLAVSDYGNARVQVLDAERQCVCVLKSFQWCDNINGHHRLFEADQSGLVEEIGLPWDVQFTQHGRLYVTDVYYHRLLLFDQQYVAQQKFGAGGGYEDVDQWRKPFKQMRKDQLPLGDQAHAPIGGKSPTEFNCPQGIAYSPSGRLYVTDTDNGRVQVFI